MHSFLAFHPSSRHVRTARQHDFGVDALRSVVLACRDADRYIRVCCFEFTAEWLIYPYLLMSCGTTYHHTVSGQLITPCKQASIDQWQAFPVLPVRFSNALLVFIFR
jgi:hypothetical protein